MYKDNKVFCSPFMEYLLHFRQNRASIGGINPSLLEAMASNCFILANNNIFNKSVLGENALYFESADDIVQILNNSDDILKKTRRLS